MPQEVIDRPTFWAKKTKSIKDLIFQYCNGTQLIDIDPVDTSNEEKEHAENTSQFTNSSDISSDNDDNDNNDDNSDDNDPDNIDDDHHDLQAEAIQWSQIDKFNVDTNAQEKIQQIIQNEPINNDIPRPTYES